MGYLVGLHRAPWNFMGKDQIMSLCCRRSVGRQTGLDFSHPGDMLRPYSRDGGGDPSQVSTPQTNKRK